MLLYRIFVQGGICTSIIFIDRIRFFEFIVIIFCPFFVSVISVTYYNAVSVVRYLNKGSAEMISVFFLITYRLY